VTPGVLILTGQTASGKSALALALAERFDAEIVGADSRQIYRGMPIGTAAPDAASRARVRHHLIDFLDPRERYSAARYVSDAMAAIADIHARGKRAIVVGGTGFYVRALTGNVTLSAAYDAEIRDRLAREARLHPPEVMHEWLAALAPQRSAAIAANDPYRVARALEVALTLRSGGQRTDAAGANTLRSGGVAFSKLVLTIAPEALDANIARRVDAMLAAGFLEEAERVGAAAVAADAVGYREALAYLMGWSTRAELRAQLVRNTRRYAKRQATWFRSEPDLIPLPAGHAYAAAVAQAGALPGWA
jgi:tRNA dimethylallyltransferase